MHINPCALQRLQIAGLDLPERVIQAGLLAGIERDAAVPGHIPVREQRQLARQQGVKAGDAAAFGEQIADENVR